MRGGGSVKAAHQRRDESSSARASSAAGRSEFRESAHTRIHLAVVKAERAPRLDVHLRLGLRGGRCRGRRGRLRRHRGVVGPPRADHRQRACSWSVSRLLFRIVRPRAPRLKVK